MFVILLACSPARQVVWDDAASSDVATDVAVSILTLGTAVEGDRELLDTLHASGTELDMEVRTRSGEAVTGWSVSTLNADICQVVAQGEGGEVLPVTLLFRAAGATDLFVEDEYGGIVDWQPIEVRDPASAEIFAWDAVALGSAEALDTIDVLPGSEATMAVAWVTEAGEPLAGTGLLDVSSASTEVAVGGSDTFAALETFDIVVSDDATPGDTSITLYASGGPVREAPVVIHAASDVTAVSLEASVEIEDEGQSGRVRAVVLADTTALVGAPARWIEDGEVVGSGSWVEFEGDPGETSELTACRGDICDTMDIPGHVTATFSPVVSHSDASCGCGSGGPAAWAAAFGALLLAGSRRR